MPEDATGTIHTGASDTWKTLRVATGLSKRGLIALNPHLANLATIKPGIPIDIPHARHSGVAARSAKRKSPYEIAKDELARDVREVHGKKHNPRIVLYHSTTAGGGAPDEVSWCSSFVNYCVEQSGRRGTDSKAARSWLNWGAAVPRKDWREGDIVVFWRVARKHWKGHVGFLVGWNGARPRVLGGNQANRVSIAASYSFGQILSVRRAK